MYFGSVVKKYPSIGIFVSGLGVLMLSLFSLAVNEKNYDVIKNTSSVKQLIMEKRAEAFERAKNGIAASYSLNIESKKNTGMPMMNMTNKMNSSF